MKTILPILFLLTQFLVCNTVPKHPSYNDLESSLEIRKSLIPKSGNGVFAKTKLEAGIVLGVYKGKFITDPEYRDLVDKDLWQYVMWIQDCAAPHAKKYVAIDGRDQGNVFTRINYAPGAFQNVIFDKLCEPPYTIIKTLRVIEKGEELYVDYGSEYDYEFMKDKDVKKFFKLQK